MVLSIMPEESGIRLDDTADVVLRSSFGLAATARWRRTPHGAGETFDQVRARRGTSALSHQTIDCALHGPNGSPNRKTESEALWSLIDGLSNARDAKLTPIA